MTPEIEALARRAVACDAFFWMPGMVDGRTNRLCIGKAPGNDGHVFLETYDCGTKAANRWDAEYRPARQHPDAWTKGCLLEIVRHAWEDSEACVFHSADGDWVAFVRGRYRCAKPTELAALVSALEAAP